MKSDDTLFKNMTGGQKAIAMLELIFKFDTNNYPILLDQPEDDLDTSGIATSVVDFIKKQKSRRQIFIVSHNGSLVVCSDSEEIIVANYNQGEFSYQT
jgi:ABC-type enterochelin transport system ATPase subunit